MRFKKSVFFVVFLLLSVSCKKEYEYSTAYIYETKFVHWGQGYYKLKISYAFEYNDSIYKGVDKTPGLYQIYGRKRYREGDSILVVYPKAYPGSSKRADNMVKRKNKTV